MSKHQNKNKKPSKKIEQYEPHNKSFYLQMAKGTHRTSNYDPTTGEIPHFMNSTEVDYSLPQDRMEFVRPSEKGYTLQSFVKPILIAVIAGVIVLVIGWIFTHEKKIALIEQTDQKQDETITSVKMQTNELHGEVETLKTDRTLDDFRIEQLEKKK